MKNKVREKTTLMYYILLRKQSMGKDNSNVLYIIAQTKHGKRQL